MRKLLSHSAEACNRKKELFSEISWDNRSGIALKVNINILIYNKDLVLPLKRIAVPGMNIDIESYSSEVTTVVVRPSNPSSSSCSVEVEANAWFLKTASSLFDVWLLLLY